MEEADRTTALADRLFAAAVDAVADAAADTAVDAAADAAIDPDRRADNASGATDATSRYRVVEVGIGDRPDIAEALADRGASVLATDVVERSVPGIVTFRRDDLQTPDRSIYADADFVYALRLPPELHSAFAALATEVDVAAAFTTLGGDPATVSTTTEQLAGGATLHWLDASATGRTDHVAGGDRG